MSNGSPQARTLQVCARLARQLEELQQEYAIGGAIALGVWGVPRGTLDVDLTLYLSPEKPSHCIWLLQDLGCDVDSQAALESFREHGFCRVSCEAVTVDVFLPTIAFYEAARLRRRRIQLGDHPVWIWDAETLTVFKMMFFRRKDVADVEQIMRTQGDQLDRGWVRSRLQEIYGPRDPRVTQWDDLTREIQL